MLPLWCQRYWSPNLKMSFGFFPDFFSLVSPSMHFFCLHSWAHSHKHAHTQHVPDNHQLQGTLHCFSSVLITPGPDHRFSQRATEGDGVYTCVFWGGMGGWGWGVRMRGHCCCQSFVTLDSPIYHSIIQEERQDKVAQVQPTRLLPFYQFMNNS